MDTGADAGLEAVDPHGRPIPVRDSAQYRDRIDGARPPNGHEQRDAGAQDERENRGTDRNRIERRDAEELCS
jgi:hypothetical protein